MRWRQQKVLVLVFLQLVAELCAASTVAPTLDVEKIMVRARERMWERESELDRE
jgi:hypothetical protein